MNVISVPIRLRIASSALFLCVPLVALEIVIVTRAPWWKLPYSIMGYWSLIFGLICFPLSSWLAAGKKWAFNLTLGLSVVWAIASLGITIRMQYPSLGFFTFFFLIFLGGALFWIKLELEKSFIDPQMHWYQGLPKPIPGLQCQVSFGEKATELRVSRMDKEGAFLFSQSSGGKISPTFVSLLERKKLEMIFTFRDRRVTCQGVPTVTTSNGRGAGIRFFGLSPDVKKEIGDFVEILRGEGYV